MRIALYPGCFSASWTGELCNNSLIIKKIRKLQKSLKGEFLLSIVPVEGNELTKMQYQFYGEYIRQKGGLWQDNHGCL